MITKIKIANIFSLFLVIIGSLSLYYNYSSYLTRLDILKKHYPADHLIYPDTMFFISIALIIFGVLIFIFRNKFIEVFEQDRKRKTKYAIGISLLSIPIHGVIDAYFF